MVGDPAPKARKETPEGRPRVAIALTLGAAAALTAAVLTIAPLREAAADAVAGDTGGLRGDLLDLGAGAVLILLALVALHTFVWYPAEIVDAAAGFVFGFWPALAILVTGWTIQGVAAYFIGRRAARPLLYRFIGEERFDRLEQAVANGGATLLLAARLVPIVPFSLFSYVAGAARVPLGLFVWTTALGYVPITALAIYFGTQLEELSPTDPLIWVSAVVLVALLLLTRRLRPLLQ